MSIDLNNFDYGWMRWREGWVVDINKDYRAVGAPITGQKECLEMRNGGNDRESFGFFFLKSGHLELARLLSLCFAVFNVTTSNAPFICGGQATKASKDKELERERHDIWRIWQI